MIRKLSALPILIFLVIVYFLYSGLSKDPTLIPSPLIGKTIPEFTSKTLFDGNTITSKDLLSLILFLFCTVKMFKPNIILN